MTLGMTRPVRGADILVRDASISDARTFGRSEVLNSVARLSGDAIAARR
jgi:hypothetical protein